MSTNTPNIGLVKPQDTDIIDYQTIFNANADKIDEQIGILSKDKAISPEDFKGTDYEKLQQAFDLSVTDDRGICISKIYDLGANTIVLKKPEWNANGKRRPTKVFGGGTIKKTVGGFMFSSSEPNTSDYFFSNITFEGISTEAVKVFDSSNANLIRVTTSKCFWMNIHTGYYSDTYVQTIRSHQDTMINCRHALFDIQGGINIVIDSMLGESNVGSLIKHGGGGAGPVKTLINTTIKNSCLETFTGVGKPVLDLKTVLSFTVDNCYFEKNTAGTIVFSSDSTLTDVSITNNHHEGDYDFPALITWGKTLIGCESRNNNSTIVPIHDTRAVTKGRVISFNDISYSSNPDLELDPSYLYRHEKELPTAIRSNEIFTNIIKNGSFETLENWSFTNASISLKTDNPFSGKSYLRVVGSGVNNSFARQSIPAITAGEKYMLYFASKGEVAETFNAFIMDAVSGANYGYMQFSPKKVGEWETFCASVTVDTTDSTDICLALFPAISTNSANKVRDFDNVSLYKVSNTYNTDDFGKAVGYTIHKSGVGFSKLDPNGDGIADIPTGTTSNRLIGLNNNQIGLSYFDTTLGKPIWFKEPGKQEVDTLTVTAGATASGNIKITLNQWTVRDIAVTAGDTAIQVADKIRATSFTGWTVSGSAETVTFTNNVIGDVVDPVFTDTGTTGVTASFTVTVAGTNNLWVDANGTSV